MAKWERDNPSHFPKGVSGNPNGRPRDPEELKEAKKLNRAQFEKALNDIIELDITELKELIKNPKTKVLTALLASVAIKGISTGETKNAEFIANRLVGKVAERIEGPNGEAVSFVGLVMLAQQRKERDVNEEED